MDRTAGLEVRDYRADDLPAVTRIWREVGWIDESERKTAALERFLGYGTALVGVVDGEAECLVHSTPGTIRYDTDDLSLCAITAVATSAVARNLGLAGRLTAEVIARGAAEGAAVAALGMFEQGFYDRLGMGTLGYVHQLTFDPAKLRVAPPARRPARISRDDWGEVAALMGRRARAHGAVTLSPPTALDAELSWVDDPFFALGFRADDAVDGDGRLTACLVGTMTGENGPLKVELLGYERGDDLLDLLGLLRSLSAQIHVVMVVEPAGVQLQDLLDRPIRGVDLLDAERKPGHEAMAWYQARIVDLPTCVSARHWPGDEVRFNLTLTDPLGDARGAGPGLQGDHTITIGETSHAEPGHRGDLPVLHASVSAFSRLWFGVRPASGLAITDDLRGSADLLSALDRALLLPPPTPGISF